MKTIITLSAMVIALGAFGQEEKNLTENNLRICHDGVTEICIDGVRLENMTFSFFRVFEPQIIQPTTVNELPNGTMPLSEDLPFVHTIRGSVYTADFLRYTVRN